MDKILIGVVTSRVKDYCWLKFSSQLKRLQSKGYEVLIIDNSDRYTPRKGFQVVNYKQPKEDYDKILELKGNPLTYITRDCMNILREYVLNNDHTHLMVLESDVIIDDSAIDRLLELDSDVANFTYWMNLERFKGNLSLCIQSIDDNKNAMMITPKDSYDLKNTGVKTLGVDKLSGRTLTHCGYGATLIRRNVLDKIPFQTNIIVYGDKQTNPFPDSFFHRDVLDNGFSNKLDTDYIPIHLNTNKETLKHRQKLGVYDITTRKQRRKMLKK